MTTFSDISLTLYRFSRPHTMAATTLQVSGLLLLATAAGVKSGPIFLIWLVTLAGCLAANIYVVGLNQLTDVAIDRINKPALPLAAGTLSRPWAWVLVLGSGIAALGIGAGQSRYLLLTLALVMLVGSLYSLPPWRFKQRPFAAALSIALARGMIANVGVYLHFRSALAVPAGRLALMAGVACFFFVFCLVIALYKDIPDWRGDQAYRVQTFAVRLGQVRVFWVGGGLLTAVYLLFAAWGMAWGDDGGRFWAFSHLAALALFWLASWRTNPQEGASMSRFYLFVWGLFYAEYLFLGWYGLGIAAGIYMSSL